MKKSGPIFLVVGTILFTQMLAITARGAIVTDSAADTAYNGGWTQGSAGGSGWASGWALNYYGANCGFFTGSSAGNGGTENIDTSSRAWGMFANSSATSEAIRQFSNPLGINQVITLRMDNGLVDTGGTVGFGLRNSSGQNRFEIFFIGGNSFYTVQDFEGSHTTEIGFTRGGLDIDFTLTGANSYSVTLKSLDGGTMDTLSGTLAGDTGSGIDRFRGFNANAGAGSDHNLYFNSIQAVPEPVNVALGAFGLLLLAGGVWRQVRSARPSGARR